MTIGSKQKVAQGGTKGSQMLGYPWATTGITQWVAKGSLW